MEQAVARLNKPSGVCCLYFSARPFPFPAAFLCPAMVAWGGGAVIRRRAGWEVAGALPIRCMSVVPVVGLLLCLLLSLLFRPASLARGRGGGWSGEQPAPRFFVKRSLCYSGSPPTTLAHLAGRGGEGWLRVCSSKLAAVAASSRSLRRFGSSRRSTSTATCCRRYPRPQGWPRLARCVVLRELIPLREDLPQLHSGI
jgi:hypothetical protein